MADNKTQETTTEEKATSNEQEMVKGFKITRASGVTTIVAAPTYFEFKQIACKVHRLGDPDNYKFYYRTDKIIKEVGYAEIQELAEGSRLHLREPWQQKSGLPDNELTTMVTVADFDKNYTGEASNSELRMITEMDRTQYEEAFGKASLDEMEYSACMKLMLRDAHTDLVKTAVNLALSKNK